MLDWPASLCPIAGGFAPFVRSLSGGQSLSGFEQVQPQFDDRWSASFTFHIRQKAGIFALRSLLTQLRGRSGTIRVPTFESARAPLSVPAPASPIGTVLFNPPFFRRWPQVAGTQFEFTALADVTGSATILAADRASFASTGTAPAVGMWLTISGVKRELIYVSGAGPYLLIFAPPLQLGAVTPGTVAALVNANATLNAISIDVHVITGTAPLAGNFFSLVDRLYAANTVTALGGGVYRLSIWPWLRVAAALGQGVNFIAPACEMRLATDGEGAEALKALIARRYGDVTLAFDEVAAIS